MNPVEIAGHRIGPGRPCFVIAEAGVNHNGSLEMALRLVEAASTTGADAVKFQTFDSARVVSPLAAKAAYQKETTGGGESQLDMVKKLELPPAAFREIAAQCRSRGIIFLSTAFDCGSADFLGALDVPAFKIPSGEINHPAFIQHLAGKGKPLIISTGMSSMEEVAAAVAWARGAGNQQIVLLQCVSNYPAQPASVNLRAMRAMESAFGVPVGFSDHTRSLSVPVAAVALGACVLEKHMTLDCSLPGPDHRASLDPERFRAMVAGIREAEAALGDGVKRRVPEEEDTARVARRSLFAARTIPAGTLISDEDIAALRPGTGLPPTDRPRLLGRRSLQEIPAGTPFRWDLVS